MKKALRIIVMVIVLFMSVSMLEGCGSNTSVTGKEEVGTALSQEKTEANTELNTEEKLKIGFSFPTQQEERWVRDKQKIEEECKKLGIDLLVGTANENEARQEEQCENMISQGIKVLIFAPYDVNSAAAIVDKAHNAGVKVISYDRLVMGTVVDIYISFDILKIGEIQGKWLTDKVDRGNIVILSGEPTDNNAKLLKDGAMKYIGPKVDSGEYRVVMEQPCIEWNPDNAMKYMEKALSDNKNNIQGVLAPDDYISGSCIKALAVQGLAGKVPITGQNFDIAAARRIIEGTQGMTVLKDTRELAKAAVNAAVKMAMGLDPGANSKVNNDKIDVPSILLVPVAIDRDNIDKILNENDYLSKDDVYKN